MNGVQAQKLEFVDNVCRDFTRATGWPLRFCPTGQTQQGRQSHQQTSWQCDLRVGHYRAGWLHVDVPTRKSVDTTEFLDVCDMADLVAQTLTSVLAAESIDQAEPLLGGGQVSKNQTIAQQIDVVLEGMLKLTGLRSAGFFLLEPGASDLRLRVSRHRDGQVIPMPYRSLGDSPLDQRALDQRLVVFRRDDGMPARWMPDNCKLGVVAAVKSNADPVGTLWSFDRRIRRLTPREQHIIESVAARIGSILQTAVLIHESEDRYRLTCEITAASANKPIELIEESMSGGEIEIASRCLPCAELGGDVSEVIIDGDEAVIGVGDASGHNLPATIVMSNLRGALYALAHSPTASHDSDQIMSRINDALEGVTQPHQFVTMVVGHLNATTRELTFTSAGHPPMILYRDGEVRLMESHGMLLGVIRGAEYERTVLKLQSGDIICCYTDGVIEVEDRERRMFKTEGIGACVQKYAHLPARGILDGIWQDVETHLGGSRCEDDRTVLILKVA